MIAKAYAKINLGLHIIGKRSDGFHDIETIFHRVDLFDVINIEKSPVISIECADPSIPTNADNLCWKAAEFLKKETGKTFGAKIAITKNIPVGAGLGGGSSDAATVLRMLNTMWGLSLTDEILRKIAIQLGSDVPFFLGSASAYGEGRGELLSPLKLDLPYWIVLVNPHIHISTPWAYTQLAESRNGTFPLRPKLLDTLGHGSVHGILKAENDFESIVIQKHPAIKLIKQQMTDHGAVLSLMSGSGSTMFGLFDDHSNAMKAVTGFSQDYFVHMTDPNFIPERHA